MTMQSLLFENTIWFVVLLVLVEYALLVVWLRRRTPRSKAAVLAGLAVCIAVPLLQRLVTTQRERIIAVCGSLVSAVEAGDVAALETHISKSFATGDLNRTQFVAVVRDSLEQSNVENASLMIDSIEIGDGNAAVVFRVRCTLNTDGYSGPFRSKWRLSFEKEGDGWFMTGVVPLDTPGFPIDHVRKLIR